MSYLVVRPSRPLHGTVALPGDKSISHRALLLGALADGATEISGLSTCADVNRTRACLADLGVLLTEGDDGTVRVTGRGIQGLSGPPVVLDCGGSGTTMRLLAGMLAGQHRRFRLDGSPELRKRPMNRVVDPLRKMGATISADAGGRPPISGQGRDLVAAEVALDRASAQAGSAVLLAGLNAGGTTVVRYPRAVRDHTERMLAEMNAAISWTATTSTIDARATPRLVPASGGRLRVPGDMSSAANLLVAGALVAGSSVSLPQVGVNPGRVGLLEVMTLMGAPVVESAWDVRCGEPVAALQVNASDQPLSAVELGGDVIPRAIDEIPLVAVLATQAHGRTIVRDAAELHHKESDRIAAIVEGLTKMGASAEARDDGFVVDGPTKLSGAAVDGRADHRIVMALAVAGLVADGETKVSDGERVADSYPGFVRALVALGAEARTTD